MLAQATHLADVLLTTHGMYYATGAKEQERFEERMRHYMEDRRSICPRTQCQEHKAKLAHCRVGQYFFNIILPDSNSGRKHSCSQPYYSHHMQYHRCQAV